MSEETQTGQGIWDQLRQADYEYNVNMYRREVAIQEAMQELMQREQAYQARQLHLYTGTEGARLFNEAIQEYAQQRLHDDFERFLIFGDTYTPWDYGLSDEEREETRHNMIMEEINTLEI